MNYAGLLELQQACIIHAYVYLKGNSKIQKLIIKFHSSSMMGRERTLCLLVGIFALCNANTLQISQFSWMTYFKSTIVRGKSVFLYYHQLAWYKNQLFYD